MATADGLFLVNGHVERAGLEGRDVTALSADGTWALAEGRSILRANDGEWAMVASLHGDRVGRCLLPVGDQPLVGTSEAGLFRGSDPVTSFETVEGRDAWYTPWGGPPDTRSLSAGTDGAVYANVHVGGIPRSDDGGATWIPTIDVDADVHQVLAHPTEARHVLAATAYGLAESHDGGRTWLTRADGLHGRYLRAVAVAGEWVMVTASEGHRGRHAAIYRTPYAGGAFERVPQVPDFTDNVDTFWLAADGDRAAFAGPDGSLWSSEDAGASWHPLAGGLVAVRALALV